ncbi:hypothetical protein [Galbibacter pacificus]|uniref:Uncharacterized protein n=1 Tax=Galbibacter pacificus TaxID=2996052 RepID=A0ABT6FS59_9FLAO|nr:hypothetical protein [Galbibacter pacificus]MDG3582945.1 hypothetical protein [Galbibacter pacificus]MDG3585936.1 hypothetical protein [Galbibacter pacificus]
MEQLNQLEKQRVVLEKKIAELRIQNQNRENRQKAIDSVLEILEKEGVSKIYYIDDRFKPDEIKTSFNSKMKRIKNEVERSEREIDTIEGFNSIEWTAPMPKFESDISDLWENGNKIELYHNICSIIGDDESSNVVPLMEIQKDFEDIVEVFTPDEWQEKEDEILNGLQETTKGLFLFDFEFIKDWKGKRGERNGVDLAKRIVESDKSESVYCGIFSHTFSVEQEDEYRIQYTREYDIEKNSFYTVSKKRYAYDPRLSAFADGVKNIVALRYIENLKEISEKILQKSIDDSFDELKAISPKTFNQIIQKSAREEGTLEVKELFRVFSLMINSNNHQSLIDVEMRRQFNNAVSRIRDIDVDTGYKYSNKDAKAIELRTKEIYFSDEIINQLNIPISNGDVFKIGNKEFILLIQPCNVSLRTNNSQFGKRNYNYNKGHLVPIRKISSGKVSPLTHQVLETTDNSDNEKYCVEFPKFTIVELDILDLAVFNPNGICKIDLNVDEPANELIQSHWKRRYEKLHSIYSNHEKAIIAFNEISDSVADKEKLGLLKPYIKKPYCIKDFNIGNNDVYNKQNRTFDFKMKRTKNYRTPYSTDLLQNFMAYLSRNAFNHDFTI